MKYAVSKTEIVARAERVPERMTGIYFLLDKGEVVYVGQTTQGIGRVFQHVGSKTFDGYSFVPANGLDVDAMECENIILHDPKYNKTLPRGSKYRTREGIKRVTGLGGWDIRRMIQNRALKPRRAHGREYYAIEDFS